MPIDLSDWRFDTGIQYRFAPPGDPARRLSGRGRGSQAPAAAHPGISVVGPHTNSLAKRANSWCSKTRPVTPQTPSDTHPAGVGPTTTLGRRFQPGIAATRGRTTRFRRRGRPAGNPPPQVGAITPIEPSSRRRLRTHPLERIRARPAQRRECLIDDLKVVESPGTPVSLLSNGDFESGAAARRFLGTTASAT